MTRLRLRRRRGTAAAYKSLLLIFCVLIFPPSHPKSESTEIGTSINRVAGRKRLRVENKIRETENDKKTPRVHHHVRVETLLIVSARYHRD